MSSIMDPAKLKVVELRAELSKRGLDAKGNKPALVKRLKEALEEELLEEIPDTSIVDTSTEDLDTSLKEPEPVTAAEPEPVTAPEPEIIHDVETQQVVEVPPVSAPVEPEAQQPVLDSVEKEPDGIPQEAEPDNNISPAVEEEKTVEEPLIKSVPEVEAVIAPEVINEEVPVSAEDVGSEQTETPKTEENVDIPMEENKENGDQMEQEEPKSRKSRWGSEVDSIESKQTEDGSESLSVTAELIEAVKEDGDAEPKGEKRKRSSPSPERAQRRRSKSPIKEDEPSIDNDKVQLNWYDSDLHLQLDKESFLSAKPYHEGAFGFAWAGVRATHGVNHGKVCFDVKINEELKWDDHSYYEKLRKDQHKSTSKHKDKSESKRRVRTESVKSESVKSETSENITEKPENTTVAKPESTDEAKLETTTETTESMETTETPPVEEPEPEATQETAAEKPETDDKMEAEEIEAPKDAPAEEKSEETEPMEEAKPDEQPAEAKPEKEDLPEEKSPEPEVSDVGLTSIHLLRVGWSLGDASLQLGEQKFSYGYESTGRFLTDKNFTDYGVKFQVGDVISSFLSADEDSVTISFAVNGVAQGEAIVVPKADLPENVAFFPHISSRNCAFELDLGGREEAWFARPEGFGDFQFVEKVEEKVAGPVRPENRSDCEVILMVGLPASGKTHWVQEHVRDNPDKRYTVLGSATLLEKMTISGENLKSKFQGSWYTVADKLQKCVNKLVDVATLRRRNYIIDQTNVFPSAQRRKLRPFEGFKRRAVVVVVGDEEQAKRQSLQEAQDGKDVSDSDVLEMKGNMSLPHKGEWLDEVIFAELPEDEAKAQVQKYITFAREAGHGIQRRYGHRDDRNRWQPRRNDYRGGNYRDNRYQNNRYDRGPPHRHGSRGGSSGGGGGGNWHHQQQQQRSGGGWSGHRDRRDNRGPPMGGGGGGGSRDWRNRGRDNRDSHQSSGGGSYHRNRSQGSGGGGGNRSSGGGGGWSSSGGSYGQSQGWNAQAWSNAGSGGGGGGGAWSQPSSGAWSGSGGGSQWKYGGSGTGGSGGSGGASGQSYAAGWSYYGQYPQNWGQQTQSAGASANQYGQYSQQEWAQYAQQYAQQGQNASLSSSTQSTTQK